jgi:hypothetical protein
MNWKSFPPSTPALLRRHVVLLVEWLRLANALKRWRSEGPSRSLFLAAAVATLAGIAVSVLSHRFAAAVDLLADYWILTTVVTAVYAASSVARRRRRIHELHLQSWLIAAPVPTASLRASQAIRTLLPAFAQFLGTALFIVIVNSMSAELRDAGKVIATIAAGLCVGAVVGWQASIDRSNERSPASRYVRLQRTRGAMRPSGQALSSWPISQVLAWSRPENSRYVLVVALFAVQGGSSAIVGLSVVAMYFIGSYLAALLSALLNVAKAAGAWLRATPMALSEFVWMLSRRALVHQALGTALAAAFMLLLGAPLVATLQIAALWLGLVISVSGCALVDGYRGRSPTVKLALSLVVWGAVLAALQLRSAGRA